MEKIRISACLLGARVGYDGSHLYFDNTNLRRWIVEGRVISVCPVHEKRYAVRKNEADMS